MSTLRSTGLAIVASLVLAACGDDGSSPPGPPASVAGLSGNNQTAVVGQALTNPIKVRVTDAGGRAVSGVVVDFAVTVGGGGVTTAVAGDLSAGEYAFRLALDVAVTTDAQGEAEATWTLGTTAGGQAATATVTGVEPFVFTATGEADIPATLALSSGDAQEGLLGETLPAALMVHVSDQYNNDVPGFSVDWAVTQGDASLAGTASVTDASGEASNTLTLGQTTGEIGVTATVASLTPVTFNALAKAQITDPAGDEFSTVASSGLVPPDIVRMTAWREGGELKIEMEFVDIVVSDDTGGTNVVVGILDIDADQDPATGVTPGADVFRPGAGSTGMGADYSVQMWMNGTGVYGVFDSLGAQQGTITPTFAGSVLTFAIPLAMLGGDDGIVNLATVVGTIPEPTDIAPEDGNLATGPQPAPVVSGAVRRDRTGELLRWPGSRK